VHALSVVWVFVLALVLLCAGIAAAAVAAGRETSLRGQDADAAGGRETSLRAPDETALWLDRSASRETSGAPAASATGTADATPTTPATITIAAVGDLLFDLGPRRLIDAHGGAAPLAKVASRLRSADLTIANLETTLSNRGAAVHASPRT
jgi:hypothetical protein